jgi:hypothetical protein
MTNLDYESPQRRPDSRLTIGWLICGAVGALTGAYMGLWLVFYGRPSLNVLPGIPCYAVIGITVAVVLAAFVMRMVRLPEWGRFMLVTILAWATTILVTYILASIVYSPSTP